MLCAISSRRDLTLLTTPPVMPIRADLVGPRVVANLCDMLRHGQLKRLLLAEILREERFHFPILRWVGGGMER